MVVGIVGSWVILMDDHGRDTLGRGRILRTTETTATVLLLGEEASQEVARERVQAIPVQYIEQIFGHPNMLDPYFMMEHFGAPNLDSGTLLPPWRAFARAEAPAPEAFTAFWGRGAFPEMSRQRIEALTGWQAGYFSNGGEVPCGVYTDGTKTTQASPRAQGFGREEGCFWWPAVGAKLRLGPTRRMGSCALFRGTRKRGTRCSS